MSAVARKPRRMHAHFPGTCQECGGDIERGDPILWSREAGARHADDDQCNESFASERLGPCGCTEYHMADCPLITDRFNY